MSTEPTVYFLCNTNGGKSQMAEALLRLRAGEAGRDVSVLSAGRTPADRVNAESAASVAGVGADMADATPTAIDDDVMRRADRVIVVGGAEIPVVDGMRAQLERWDVDEPNLRGIDGEQRMDLIRDDIDARVRKLLDELPRP
ncbi:low molecular weight phosphatase family protein [uncultured Corynebacterium sp.]|uniref:arsenate-mycothiol transferase ArsC n=1 Tax=uncultured Corynebacterium sp. TaxID=159447 RepID=UPI0025E6D653|nr:low molecular weight phosphatase family protein [uncultured Corynebacterium sp.]